MSIQELNDALNTLDPGVCRDEWFRILAAYKAGGGSEENARSWSAQADSYDTAGFRATWKSIKAGAITERTLFALAIESGFRPRPEATPKVVSVNRLSFSEGEAAAQKARHLSTTAPANHPYLVGKGVKPFDIGVLGEKYTGAPAFVRGKGNLLVIAGRTIEGLITVVQYIAEDGSKAFNAGGRKRGSFHVIRGGKTIWICEGYATGASLHQDTGDTVVVAFDAGNLGPVANVWHALYGLSRPIKIMADDDHCTPGNPGLTKAREAGTRLGIEVHKPDFAGLSRGDKDSDYNDFARLRDGN